MRALSAIELLDLWEQAAGESLAERALRLLAAACPERGREAIAQLPMGRRDAELLELRRGTFGDEVVGTTTCPQCDERLETAVAAASLLDAAAGESTESGFVLAVDGYEVIGRLPGSVDLCALSPDDTPERAREQLLRWCIPTACQDGQPIAPTALPSVVLAAAEQRMAELDPGADLRLALSCPSCGHQWEAVFDIASFLWAEIDAWAERTVRDVDRLASAYGWSETDILRLSPARRECYLELTGA